MLKAISLCAVNRLKLEACKPFGPTQSSFLPAAFSCLAPPRLEAEVNAKGSAHVKYVPVPGGPQHDLVIKPNTQATIQVDQGEMNINFQRQPTGEQQFEKMKSLVGKWHIREKDKSGPNEVIYSLLLHGQSTLHGGHSC